MRIQKLVVCVGALMAALIFAGCTADSQESGAGEESGADPLWAALGFDSSSGWGAGAIDSASNERSVKVQDLVAQCMKDAGYDYIPVVVPAAEYDEAESRAQSILLMAGGWLSREDAAKYGYGVSTYELHNQDTIAEDEEPGDDEAEAVPDPNRAIMDAMTADEKRSYSETLYGSLGEGQLDDGLSGFVIIDEDADPEATEGLVESSLGTIEYDWRDAGCLGQAEHKVDGDIAASDDVWADGQYSDLVDEINNHWGNVTQTRAVQDLYAEWRQCMDEHGVSGIQDPDSAIDYFWGPFSDAAQFDEDTGELLQTAEMKALQAEETRTAVADYDCRIEIDYVDRLRQADYDYQQEYLDTHRHEVDGFRNALAYAAGTGG